MTGGGLESGFGARARAAMDAYGPLCVGIDPHAALVEQWGLPDSVEGLERFATACVEAFAGHVAFVKPQSAFFERCGAGGVAVLERTIQELRHAGTLVILDVKRGDIGSTAAAYAEAYLDEDSPMCADAVTVSPYLGFGSLGPFFETAERNDTGVFVLALTSNPEGPEVQRAHIDTAGVPGRGRLMGTVAGAVLAQLKTLNGDRTPMGPFGAVVGATLERMDEDVAFNGPILAPGLGAQGGTAEDVARLFGPVADRVLPSISRGVLKAGPEPAALRDSAAQANAELVRSLEMYRTSRSPA